MVRSVLFASAGVDSENAALQSAYALAQTLQVELHISRVLAPRRSLLSKAFGIFASSSAPARSGDALQRERRRVERWCSAALPRPISSKRVQVWVGSLVASVAEHSAALDAPVIVLSPETSHLGLTATSLACASSRPVLVARGSAVGTTVLVASDLEADDIVLNRAVFLGRQIGGSIVLLHNVACLSRTLSRGSPALARLLHSRESEGAGSHEGKPPQHPAPLSTIMTNERDPVDAIIGQARRHGLDAIVVGTSTRTRFERWLDPSTAAAVVDRADRSVFVTPPSPMTATDAP